MRTVVQRVSEASVTVEGRTVSSIGPGILVLAAFRTGDDAGEIEWMARKVLELRIFEDEQGKMNRSVLETQGEVLERSAVSERRVIIADVPLRTGYTWYTDLGDAPFIVALVLALAAAMAWSDPRLFGPRPAERGSDLEHEGDGAVVDQLDAHVGAEATAGDRRPEPA